MHQRIPQNWISVALLALLACSALGDDWPQWRGPSRDGVWRETGIIEKFDGPEIPIRWRAKVSSGYSGPTVADGRVYVSDRVAQPKQMERVLCFDARTGAPVWAHAYDCTYRKVSYPAGPRASITLHDGRAYSLGTMGHLFCLDSATGHVRWHKDTNAEYKTRIPVWGIASAPLIERDLVIVQIGGRANACLVAFDRRTGEEKWRALSDRCSYSTPIVIEQAGQRVLVCWTGDSVAGLNPLSGEVHWQHPFPPVHGVIGVATPVADHGRLFVSNFYEGSLMLRLASDKLAVEQVWKRKGASERQTDSLHALITTPILDGDYVYGVDSYGELRCLDARNGDRIWESLEATPKIRWGTIHFVRNRDKVWMLNEQGELLISRLSPQGFEEISRAKLIRPTKKQHARGVCWSHPAFANRHVFARNDEELVCASLEAR